MEGGARPAAPAQRGKSHPSCSIFKSMTVLTHSGNKHVCFKVELEYSMLLFHSSLFIGITILYFKIFFSVNVLQTKKRFLKHVSKMFVCTTFQIAIFLKSQKDSS